MVAGLLVSKVPEMLLMSLLPIRHPPDWRAHFIPGRVTGSHTMPEMLLMFLLQDDPCLMDYNVQQRVDEFVKACEDISSVTHGNDIMLPMGTDFTYANAHYW